MKPRIALVVATYNRREPLRRLLDALASQTLAIADWELVVAVDGSNDGTAELLAFEVRRGRLPLHFFTQKNQGQAAARHAAIEVASAPHVIVIDDDMDIVPGFVQAHLDASLIHPGTGVVIGKVVPQEGWRERPLYEAVREHFMQELHARFEAGVEAPTATAFITQNVSFPRALYFAVGGFDPSLRLDEDRELGVRLARAGGLFIFAAAAAAVHRSDVGAYATWYRRQREYGGFAVQVWEKHGRDPRLHPLRNFVTGSRLNRWLVKAVCPVTGLAEAVAGGLRLAGVALQQLGFFEIGIATHKAIQAIAYHLGVKMRLGSWSALQHAKRDFLSAPNRPEAPTGRGPV